MPAEPADEKRRPARHDRTQRTAHGRRTRIGGEELAVRGRTFRIEKPRIAQGASPTNRFQEALRVAGSLLRWGSGDKFSSRLRNSRGTNLRWRFGSVGVTGFHRAGRTPRVAYGEDAFRRMDESVGVCSAGDGDRLGRGADRRRGGAREDRRRLRRRDTRSANAKGPVSRRSRKKRTEPPDHGRQMHQ